MSDLIPNDYTTLLAEVKERIRTAQYAALRAVNKELITLYWDIGQMIVTRQQGETWGRSIVQRLAADLHNEFPGITGFSAQNLWRMRQFYEAYADSEKLSPLVREIGWTHNVIILMQFYLAVLDDQVRLPDESPSIGIILCKSKDKTIVEYALRESNKPIGVGTYRIVTELPAELKGQLPSPEQIARLLEGIE